MQPKRSTCSPNYANHNSSYTYDMVICNFFFLCLDHDVHLLIDYLEITQFKTIWIYLRNNMGVLDLACK